jgi:hypothetical protein
MAKPGVLQELGATRPARCYGRHPTSADPGPQRFQGSLRIGGEGGGSGVSGRGAWPARQRYTAVQAEQRPPVGRLVLDDDLNVAHRRTEGNYAREEAIAAIDKEGTLPDMLTFNPSKPAEYPNGRVFTDDVINYRLAFLTKGECPPTGLSPHTDTLHEFPYLGTPH